MQGAFTFLLVSQTKPYLALKGLIKGISVLSITTSQHAILSWTLLQSQAAERNSYKRSWHAPAHGLQVRQLCATCRVVLDLASLLKSM